MKTCPRCEIPLEEAAVGGVTVDGCHGCGGVWFDNSELGVVAQQQPSELATLEDRFQAAVVMTSAATPALCPNCRAALFTFEFPHSPGIQLDGCTQCKGIWADDGELQAIHSRIVGAQSEARAEKAGAATTTHQKARQALGFLSSMTCPDCAELNPTTALSCWACGIALKGRRIALCPVCHVPMADKRYADVRVDVCECCASIWLDRGELSTLIRLEGHDKDRLLTDVADPVIDAKGAVRPEEAFCPVCSQPLAEQRYAYDSDIRVDMCEGCNGVWLGQGEIERAVAHYNTARTRGRVV